MKEVRLTENWAANNFQVNIFSRGGGKVKYVKRFIVEEGCFGALEKIPDDAVAFSVSSEDLRTLYQSLKDEMIRTGLLSQDLSLREQELLKTHLKDAISVRDKLLGAKSK